MKRAETKIQSIIRHHEDCRDSDDTFRETCRDSDNISKKVSEENTEASMIS